MRPVFAARRRMVTRSVWPCETTSMLIESTWGWSGLVCCRRIGTDSSREPGQGQSVKTGTCPRGWVAVASWHATGGVGGTQPHEREELIPTTIRDLSGASAAPFSQSRSGAPARPHRRILGAVVDRHPGRRVGDVLPPLAHRPRSSMAVGAFTQINQAGPDPGHTPRSDAPLFGLRKEAKRKMSEPTRSVRTS
jgi:hypothetical protein